MSNSSIFVVEPISDFFENSIELPELSNSLSLVFGTSTVNSIFIGEVAHYNIKDGYFISAYLELPSDSLLNIPELNILQIKLGSTNQNLVTNFSFIFKNENNTPFWKFSLKEINVSIHFNETILRKVDAHSNEDAGAVLVFTSGISIDSNFKIGLSPVDVSLERSFIGPSNFIISAEKIQFNLVPSNTQIILKNLKFEPPQELFDSSIAMPAFEIKEATINNDGFSGTVSVEWQLNYQTNKFLIDIKQPDGTVISIVSKLFGIPGGIKYFSMQFEKNIPVAVEINGLIRIPYFDKDVAVKVLFNSNGRFNIGLDSLNKDGLELSKDELISFYLKSILIDQDNQSLTLSGGLEPLLFSKEGVKWPRIEVKNLNISSDGKLSIDEAWMDLKEVATLNLFGFYFEVRKIGFGTSRDDKLWIDISGSVKLIEQIPLGLDVEGFRITWPRELDLLTSTDVISDLQKIEIQFAGVELNIATPGIMKIDGLIRFIKEPKKVGFAGDMKLAVIPAGFTAEAGLMVGMNFESPAYPFLYVYFGFESSAGIPLAQTGLALKGAIGLIGMNVAPSKTPEQNWFYDWYKGPPEPGVHQTTKWTDKRDAFAIGIGITISTADGVVKSTKGLLVLAVPGPLLVIEGKAIILNPSGEGEGPFGALAVFDGNEGTVQFNIEAQAELVKDMIYASAGVEAFFDFTDITNWHLYLGKDEPYNRRIQANVMDIMTADAYLMLDMVGSSSPRTRMGVNAKIEPKMPSLEYEVNEDLTIGIKIDAWFKVGGSGEASINPDQFSGSVDIEGELTIRAFEIEFGISGEAHVSFEGPRPFSFHGEARFNLNFPWPIPDYRGTAEIDLKSPYVELKIEDPVQSVSLFSRFTSESKGASKSEYSDEILDAENSVVVPVDVKPVIDFNHEMNFGGDNFLTHPDDSKFYKSGRIKLIPTLKYVKIYEKKKSEPWDSTGWGAEVFSTKEAGLKKLWGVWIAESNPQNPENPSTRKLFLFNDTPLINTALTIMLYGIYFNQEETALHLSELLLRDYPGLMLAEPRFPDDVCINFFDGSNNLPYQKYNGGQTITFQNFRLYSKNDYYMGRLETKDNTCYGLYASGNLEITFPEEVVYCSITYCSQHLPENIVNGDNHPLTGSGDSTNSQDSLETETTSIIKPLILYFNGNLKVIEFSGDLTVVSTENKWLGHMPPSDELGIISFNKIVMQRDNMIITGICYKTKSDYDNYVNADDIHDRNSVFPVDEINNASLNPGCYYKIEIKSEVQGVQGTFSEEEEKYDVKEAYDEALDEAFGSNNLKSFTVNYFFQTDSPPNNLNPYIKWTYPNMELNRVFCNARFAVCFKREYLKHYFGGEEEIWKNYEIVPYVQDANNNLQKYETEWSDSNCITLFPDEYTWEKYKRDYGYTTGRKENILRINRPSNKGLLTENQKYSLILTGGDGGKILIPSRLEVDEMKKYWNYNSKWLYDINKNLTASSNPDLFLSVKNDYENIEAVFELNGNGSFEFIFRYKKLSNGKEIYNSIKFTKINERVKKPIFRKETLSTDKKLKILDDLNDSQGLVSKLPNIKSLSRLPSNQNSHKIEFYTSDGNNNKTLSAEIDFDFDDYNDLEWKKFKLRIIGNYVKIFCFEKYILKELDGFNLDPLSFKNADIRIENNKTGNVGFKKINSGTKVRNLSIKDAELLRIPFYANGFNNRGEMFKPTNNDGKLRLIETEEEIDGILISNYSGPNDYYSRAAIISLNYYKALIDLDYGMATYKEGTNTFYDREAVEKYKLDLRNANKIIDDEFNSLVLNLVGSEFFNKVTLGLDIFGIKNRNYILGLYIKSPEKLYMKNVTNANDPYARTTLKITVGNNSPSMKLIFNSDGDQLLLKFDESIEIEVENKKDIKFEFVYISNFKDDEVDDISPSFFEGSGVKHHRYDRPFIFRQHSITIQEFILQV